MSAKIFTKELLIALQRLFQNLLRQQARELGYHRTLPYVAPAEDPRIPPFPFNTEECIQDMSFLTLSEFKEEAKGDRDVRESWDTWRSLTKQDGSKTGRLPQDFTPKQWFAMEHAVTSLSKSCTSSTSTLPIASGEGPNVQVRNAHRLFSSMPVRPFANKNVLEFTSRRRNVKCYCLRQVVVVVDLKDLPFCTPGHSSTAIGCIAARQIVTSPSFGPARNFLFLFAVR